MRGAVGRLRSRLRGDRRRRGLGTGRSVGRRPAGRDRIVDGKGNPVGWADKAALQPPSASAPFDPKTEQLWWDKLVPVQDDRGTLIGYYLNGYGFITRALAESPALDVDALRSQRAATAPLPPRAVGAAPDSP